jgi:hypothetical protein
MAAHATMAAPAAVATTSCATALLSSPHSRRRPSRKLAAGASISFDGNAFVNRNAGMVRVQAADGATGWVPCSSVSLQCEAVRRRTLLPDGASGLGKEWSGPLFFMQLADSQRAAATHGSQPTLLRCTLTVRPIVVSLVCSGNVRDLRRTAGRLGQRAGTAAPRRLGDQPATASLCDRVRRLDQRVPERRRRRDGDASAAGAVRCACSARAASRTTDGCMCSRARAAHSSSIFKWSALPWTRPSLCCASAATMTSVADRRPRRSARTRAPSATTTLSSTVATRPPVMGPPVTRPCP